MSTEWQNQGTVVLGLKSSLTHGQAGTVVPMDFQRGHLRFPDVSIALSLAN